MDSRGNRNRSSSQDQHRNPIPDLNLSLSTSTSQSNPNRLTIDAQIQQNQMVQRRPDSVGFGDGRGIESPRRRFAFRSHGGRNSYGRGRPPDSKKRQPEPEPEPEATTGATDGIGFIPHIFNVKPGEDIGAKLIELSERGPRTICIMSGIGNVGRVTLSDTSKICGMSTYEGPFKIVTLAGSFLNCEVNGIMTRMNSLTVTLGENDGRVIGGGVIGQFVAATDVYVVLGSFLVEPTNRYASGNNMSSSFHPLQPPNNMSCSIRGTPSAHSALQQHHQQLRHHQRQEQQWRKKQEQQQRQQ